MPKLAPIDPTMEAAIVRHVLRNIFALGEDGIGAARPELQCKTRDFQNGRLWGQFSPSSELAVESSLDHVTYPPSSTPETWNFGAICRHRRDMESAGFDPPTGLALFSEEIAQKFHFPGVELGGYTT